MSRRAPTVAVLGAALWVVLVSAAGALLGGLGWWSPWVGWPVAVVLGALAGWAVRRVPGVDLPRSAALALVGVVTALTAWTAATHSEQVLPRRDAASNLQAAVSLATTHTRVVPVDPAPFGGPDVLALDGVTLASPAFYEVGTPAAPAVQPQFVVAPAVVYGLGWWAGGARPAMVLPAVASGLALLALGLLVSGVMGSWWGVAAAGLTGVLFPVVHTARATYSEPLALLTLTAALLAVTLAARERPDAAASARLGLLAGVLLGGTGLVRVDALREVVLVLPALAVAAALGARWVRPFLAGLGGSLAIAAVAALALSPRYLGDIAGSLVPLVALGVLLAGLSWGGLVLWRRGRRLPAGLVRRLPDAAAVAVIALGSYLASRPLWQVVRQDPTDPGSRYVAGMQARQGLPVDGGRTYAEQTVAWLAWWVGPVALLVALVALAALVRRALLELGRGRMVAWLPALLVAAGSTALTLLRPGITPDHPWADRRLLVALPLVVVLDVVAAAWLARLRPRAWPAGGAVAAGAVLVALAVPAVAATWPHRSGGVERGSLAAVDTLCSYLGPGDVVLAVDARAANEWPQVVRGMCGTPALSVTAAARRDSDALARTVAAVRAGVEDAGGRVVLLAADSADAIDGLGFRGEQVTDIVVREDEHALEHRPDGTDPLPIRVWLVRPS
ncbi:MAG TPA: hypothetical protein VF140_04050 [Phycicoccus sp.]